MTSITTRPLLRRTATSAVAVLAAAALAACGSDDGGSDATTAAGGATGGAFPVTITHKFGRTEVPKAPQRVVAVGYNDQDFALALGVTPLGFRQFQGADIADRPWAREALGGAKPEVVGETDLGVEKIAALRPDLLLAVYSGITSKEYGTLSELAPTVAQSAKHVDYGEPWQEQLRTTGEALGREQRAAEVEKDVEAGVAKAREADGTAGRSVVLASGSDGKFFAFASADLRSRFFTALGMKVPGRIDRLAGKTFYADVSEERLDLLEADLLVIYGDEQELLKRPTFARLKAVREGRVVYLDEQGAISQAVGFSSPLSIPYALAKLRPRIAAAIDGDPATKPQGTGPAFD
ncbi:iron-siderophore ABC transporter substrate-binding protein [Patulibacter sp.]|uniref:iron-siderophore ABC transporter substrate-binding protein n=1 Tax=Patulibacter sp. TaxID=1912859 RepID=UPI00271A6696|nr:iron-siderophore ABC transporter substrate-binding protein [Patulibacter sp.]MDO9407494.1 iron-siderophore ABC transporter substrate-binding protein [Patulibacter sp.]